MNIEEIREALLIFEGEYNTAEQFINENSHRFPVVKKALRLVEKLMGEPSVDVSREGAAEMWEQTKSLGCACGGHDQATAIHKAMLTQSIKEVEGE